MSPKQMTTKIKNIISEFMHCVESQESDTMLRDVYLSPRMPECVRGAPRKAFWQAGAWLSPLTETEIDFLLVADTGAAANRPDDIARAIVDRSFSKDGFQD